jgi:Tol biopolymer transport system component
MPLTPGIRLGPYEIIAPLGAGGMGEVYKARDTRLDRTVAIKILTAGVADDPQRQERFRREARAISSLTHTHICTLHDIGEQDGVEFLVMEYLAGETLAHRLLRGALPLEEVLRIAVQLADALDAARRAGLTHRDLKPANVMLTASGAKVLDFGLAKWHGSHPDVVSSVVNATAHSTLTQVGIVVGTIQYMAPEQVEGKAADSRSDLFSLGAIVYEMTTGQRAFAGTSTTSLMAAILTSAPAPMATVQPITPPALERVVTKCLAKDPSRRWQSAADLRDALSWVGEDLRPPVEPASATPMPTAGHPPAERRPRWARWAIGVAGAATLGILAIVAVGQWIGPVWVARLPALAAPRSFRQLTFRRGNVHAARFAPDGRTIVYSAEWDGPPMALYTTRIEAPESRRLDVPAAGLFALSNTGEMAISNHCQWVMGPAMCDGTLARVPLTGGLPREVLEDGRSANWVGGELAVIHETSRGWQLEFPLGTVVYESAGQMAHLRLSPSRSLAAISEQAAGREGGSAILVIDRKGVTRTLTSGLRYINGLAWSPDGQEVWFTASSLLSTMFQLEAVTLDGHRRVLDATGNSQLLDVARDGRVLIARRVVRADAIAHGPTPQPNLSWFDFTVADALSRDGKRLLFSERGEAVGGSFTLYVRDTDGSPAIKLGKGSGLALSPDGKWTLARSSPSPGITTLTLFPIGAGQPRSLESSNLNLRTSASFLPDGHSVVFAAQEDNRPKRTYVQALDGLPGLVAHEPGAICSPLSPDGSSFISQHLDGTKWLARLAPSDSRRLTIAPEENVIEWHADGHSLFIGREQDARLIISRLELQSGRRFPVEEIAVPDPAGFTAFFGGPFMTPDGRLTVFTVARNLADVFLVEG